MMFELFYLALLPRRDVNGPATVWRWLARERQGGRSPQQRRELLQRLLRSWDRRSIAGASDELLRLKPGLGQSINSIAFCPDAVEAGGFQTAFLSCDIWHGAVFNDQTSRRNQRRQLCVAKFP